MPHENSETVQGQDGRWININGETRERLVPMFSFEADSYDTKDEAVAAATRRSDMFGQGQPTVPGESPPPAPSAPSGRIIPLREFLGMAPPNDVAGRMALAIGARRAAPGALTITPPSLLEQAPEALDFIARRATGAARFVPPLVENLDPSKRFRMDSGMPIIDPEILNLLRRLLLANPTASL